MLKTDLNAQDIASWDKRDSLVRELSKHISFGIGSNRAPKMESFTDAQVKALGLANEQDVWRGKATVGLIEAGLLYSIEDIRWEQVAGKTVSWKLLCNSPDQVGG